MNRLKRAAKELLERVYSGKPRTQAAVEWLSFGVQLEGRREIVSLYARGEGLATACTCAQPDCAHVRAALALLCESDGPYAERASEPWEPPPATLAPSDLRTVDQSDQSEGADTAALSEALEDLLLAVVRAGVGAGVSAAVEEALQRLVRAAPAPPPLGVSRWVGRLKRALATCDADDAARLLSGASLLIDDLKSGAGGPEARKRVLSWLGSHRNEIAGVARLTDRTLIEIAREELPGIERAGVERRYLIDLRDGAVYREERAPSASTVSIGPCPRAVTVWLAIAEQGAKPHRLRLLQYAVTPVIDAEIWEKVEGFAQRDFDAVRAQYLEAERIFPGLSEPFVLVAPERVGEEGAPLLFDGAGRALPLHHPENPSALRYLEAATNGAAPSWVAGRLHDRGGTLALAPLGAGLRRGGKYDYVQM